MTCNGMRPASTFKLKYGSISKTAALRDSATILATGPKVKRLPVTLSIGELESASFPIFRSLGLFF
jgi:hypothetical protein